MNRFNENDILIECVPNFSEGRNKAIIDEIANAIESEENVKLLHIDIGYDANRTVFTFVGTPTAIVNAAYKAIEVAYHRIDMQQHDGKHPRMGACDVCPFIPLQNIDMQSTNEYIHLLANKLSNLDIPIYLYETSANIDWRKNLANLRKGEYEALPSKISNPEWQPDYGNFINYKKFGMMALGARKFLIAYNVNLHSKDLEIGKKIAQEYRSDRQNIIKIKYSKAIAWYIEEYQCVQISTNINDFEQTSIFDVFDHIKTIADKYNISTNGSELIGLIPQKALLNNNNSENKDKIIDDAIKYLGLDSLRPFNKHERILEYLL